MNRKTFCSAFLLVIAFVSSGFSITGEDRPKVETLAIIAVSDLALDIKPVLLTENSAVVYSSDIPPGIDNVAHIMPDLPGEYYFMRIRASRDLQPLEDRILYVIIDNTVIFKTDRAGVEELSAYGWGLTRIAARPVTKALETGHRPPMTTEYDPDIDAMILGITPELCESTLIGLTAFNTRYSYAQQCRLAEQQVFDIFNTFGLSSSFFQFNLGGTDMRNVVGQMTGTAVPESVVIICGHLDCTSNDRYNNAPGAEDNGSGSAAVIEAARVLSLHLSELTIRFITFSGEEQGLIGSDFYAQEMLSQGQNIAAVINLDMIAYTGPYPADMHIFSDPLSHWLGSLASETMITYTDVDTITHYDGSPVYGSDHYPFAIRGFPAMFFIDGWDGSDWYPYYHTTADTIGNLDMDLLADVSRTAAAMAAILARVEFGLDYLPGDANGSGDVNGLDVIYLVNYFKGLGPVPYPIERGDANGDCAVNGLDVVYLVNYLKGGSAPLFGDCR